MDDDTPKPPMQCARPLGSGMQDLDAALFAEVDALIGSGKAADAIEAARILVAAGKVAGHGTAENKAQRLARRFREQQTVRIISQPGADSDSLPGMDTHAIPTGPQPDLGALLARLAALEAREAEREATVTQLRTAVMESDAMMATVITRQVDIEERLEAAGEALTRQAEAAERIAMTGELRLDALHAPTNVSARRN
jgi:hypothetical protein